MKIFSCNRNLIITLLLISMHGYAQENSTTQPNPSSSSQSYPSPNMSGYNEMSKLFFGGFGKSNADSTLSKAASSSTSGMVNQMAGPLVSSLGLNTGGDIGTSWINGIMYYQFRLGLNFKIWKFKIGLQGILRIDEKGQIRQEDWNNGILSYMKIIQYLQFAEPEDPFYIRLGRIDFLSVGSGAIMNFYNNSVVYDFYKIGVSMAVNTPIAGFHVIGSDMTQAAIFGARLYVKPFEPTHIPILDILQVGVSTFVDGRSTSSYTAGNSTYTKLFANPSSSVISDNILSANPMTVLGADIIIPFKIIPNVWDLTVSFDYLKFLNYGQGVSAAVVNRFNIVDVVMLGIRLEHQENFGQMQFGYFNALYEFNRFVLQPNNQVSTLANDLLNITPVRGLRLQIFGDVLKRIIISGGYEFRYNQDPMQNPSLFNVMLDAPNILPLLQLRAEYFKSIRMASDFLSLDGAVARFTAVYNPFPFFYLSLLSILSFEPVKDASGNITSYKPTFYLSPKISFGIKIM